MQNAERQFITEDFEESVLHWYRDKKMRMFLQNVHLRIDVFNWRGPQCAHVLF